ncbi:hypothetical protein H5410_025499 [Solanum commersonii]|uniref:Uncharacterized protein n=1 Tax=Solanum commersonii TaxID=4109 RepID=A0A9J5YW50_SOLCO|nr:hypothetical protein H5410_025499 [Solanum commersonii]
MLYDMLPGVKEMDRFVVSWIDEKEVVAANSIDLLPRLLNSITITSFLRESNFVLTCCNSSLKNLQAFSRSSSLSARIVSWIDEKEVVAANSIDLLPRLLNSITITSFLRESNSVLTCCNSSLKNLQAFSRSSSLSARSMFVKHESTLSSAL